MEGAGLTFKAAAKKIGCSAPAVHAWVNGVEPKGLYRERVLRVLREWERSDAKA